MPTFLPQYQIISKIGRDFETGIIQPETGQNLEAGAALEDGSLGPGWEDDVGKMTLLSLSLIG